MFSGSAGFCRWNIYSTIELQILVLLVWRPPSCFSGVGQCRRLSATSRSSWLTPETWFSRWNRLSIYYRTRYTDISGLETAIMKILVMSDMSAIVVLTSSKLTMYGKRKHDWKLKSLIYNQKAAQIHVHQLYNIILPIFCYGAQVNSFYFRYG
jgi:hypothetical protein